MSIYKISFLSEKNMNMFCGSQVPCKYTMFRFLCSFLVIFMFTNITFYLLSFISFWIILGKIPRLRNNYRVFNTLDLLVLKPHVTISSTITKCPESFVRNQLSPPHPLLPQLHGKIFSLLNTCCRGSTFLLLKEINF